MTYRAFKKIEDWKDFKKMVKNTKQSFFDDKIQEITLKNQRLCDLMNWVKKQKLLAIKIIQFNR